MAVSLHSKKRRADAPWLNDEMMFEILSRLPTKSLRRFQCVARAWGDLISHVFNHKRILGPMTGLIVNRCTCPVRQVYVSLVDEKSEEDFRAFESKVTSLPCLYSSFLVHSCNGLLLFVHRDADIYSVCNPTTMECVVLPAPFFQRPKHNFLAYDPRESPHYKVVLFNTQRGTHIELEIYSSSTGEWEVPRLLQEPPLFFSTWMDGAVFHRGALHILGNPDHIASFDVERRCIQGIVLPEEVIRRTGFSSVCLGESRGCLRLAFRTKGCYILQVWVLNEEGADKWVMEHSASVKIPTPPGGPYAAAFGVLAFHPDTDVLFLTTTRRILSYHPDSGVVKEVCKISRWRWLGRFWTDTLSVFPCLESLDPPGGSYVKWQSSHLLHVTPERHYLKCYGRCLEGEAQDVNSRHL